MTTLLGLHQVEAVKVHHLDPGRYEVADEPLMAIGTGIDFSIGTQHGVGTKDQFIASTAVLQITAAAIPTLKQFRCIICWFPFRAHIQQVDEKVIAQHPHLIGEDTLLAAVVIGP